MTGRRITGFHRDEEEHWVADLECGHAQHVRHRPPFEVREWVTTEEGRASRLGVALECGYCEMPSLPEGARVYRSTKTFDEETIPRALREEHRTKPGTWGRIVVEAGRLRYVVEEPERREWVLRAGVAGIIAPEALHHVEPLGAVRFRVEFVGVSRRIK